MSDEVAKVELDSPDLAAEKLAAFQDLFPGVIADGVLDAGRLGDLLDTEVAAPADGRERFGLMWAGKQEAVRSLLAPSRGALLPDFGKSMNFDESHNTFIEGDNLEVLKLLQKAYNDKIKLIYIDPPYNTGNDFVYNDDFKDGLRGYLEFTGQVDADGNRTSASTDTAGRRHSRWLSMIYPRLVLARNLLTQDGAIFVSIDDNEAMNLRAVMDEVFGEENFVAQMVWAAGRKNDSKLISESHEYIIVYARNVSSLIESAGTWRTKKEGLGEINKEYSRLRKIHGDDHDAVTKALKAWYRSLPIGDPSKRHEHYSQVDARGIYFPSDLSKNSPTSRSRYDILHPRTGKPVNMPANGWRYAPESMEQLLAEDRIRFGADETTRPTYKRYLSEAQDEIPYSVFYVDGRGASGRLKSLLGGSYFENPKDETVLQKIIEFASGDGDIVLDFFAGSGSTVHAVELQNALDGKQRRWIAVNIPEATAEASEARKAGFETVSQITLARIQAALEQASGGSDRGLRTYRLAGSCFRDETTADPEDLFDLRESTLDDGDHVMEELAGEVLLKEGVALDAQWVREKADVAEVISADGVAVVLSLDITEAVANAAIALKPRVLVFLEDGFAGRDAVKTNAFTNAKNLGITVKTV